MSYQHEKNTPAASVARVTASGIIGDRVLRASVEHEALNSPKVMMSLICYRKCCFEPGRNDNSGDDACGASPASDRDEASRFGSPSPFESINGGGDVKWWPEMVGPVQRWHCDCDDACGGWRWCMAYRWAGFCLSSSSGHFGVGGVDHRWTEGMVYGGDSEEVRERDRGEG